jgi:hypothetical protein
MEPLHLAIINLIMARRCALTMQQIDKSIIGWNTIAVEHGIAEMIRNGLLTSMQQKGHTFYQLTLNAFNAHQEGHVS